ncbi:hypothetical protein NW759_005103 [Fusarium solani]|nr:hypothetical protein NW759_005103 [Fusarium solani]
MLRRRTVDKEVNRVELDEHSPPAPPPSLRKSGDALSNPPLPLERQEIDSLESPFCFSHGGKGLQGLVRLAFHQNGGHGSAMDGGIAIDYCDQSAPTRPSA